MNKYHYGLKKQYNPEGYYWCPSWKLYNDSEGDYETFAEADTECAVRNLALVIERGYADNLMLKGRQTYRSFYTSVIEKEFELK